MTEKQPEYIITQTGMNLAIAVLKSNRLYDTAELVLAEIRPNTRNRGPIIGKKTEEAFRPSQRTVAVTEPEENQSIQDLDWGDSCPECGEALSSADVVRGGAEIRVIFCPNCGWEQ